MNQKKKVMLNVGMIFAVLGIMVMAASIAVSFSSGSGDSSQFIAVNLWRFLSLLLFLAVGIALYVYRLRLQNSEELRQMFESGTLTDIVANALARRYAYLVLIDIDDDCIIYSSSSNSADTWVGNEVFVNQNRFSDSIKRYAISYILAEDRAEFERLLSLDNISNELIRNEDFCFCYRIVDAQRVLHAEISISSVKYKAGKKYCILTASDAEESAVLRSQITLRDKVIDVISDDICCISRVNPLKNTIQDIRVSPSFQSLVPGWLDTNNYTARIMLLVNQAVVSTEKDKLYEQLTSELVRLSIESGTGKTFVLPLCVEGSPKTFQLQILPYTSKAEEMIFVFRRVDETYLKLQQSSAQNAVISALTGDFLCVSYVDLIQNRIENYRISDHFANCIPGWRTITDYAVRIRLLADSLVIESDRERFLLATSPGSILRGLSTEQVYYVVFRMVYNGETRIFQVKYVQDPDNSNAVVFGIHDVNVEKRQEMERQAQENAEIIRSDSLNRLGFDLVKPLDECQTIVDEMKMISSGSEQLKEQIHRLEGTAQKLYGIANNIQNMTQAKTQTSNKSCAPMNMIQFANDCSTAIADAPRSKNICFVTDFADIAHPNVFGDELRLRQIVQNLLENAIKFTPENGKVVFRIGELRSDEEAVTFKIDIKDTGSGMQQDILEHIWDIFTLRDDFSGEGNTDVSRNLAVSKTVADSIGATITVESNEGTGTNFCVLVPLAHGPDVDSYATDAEVLNGLHVLLAEDNELNLGLARELLESVGAIVTSVSGGQEALDAFVNSATGEFSLVLMDLMMPGIDGSEATRRIRSLSRPDAGNVPIFALIANASEEDLATAKSSGINVFLNKPLQMTSLISAMIRFINRKSQRLEIELATANAIATTDALTGVRNRTAFEEMEKQINTALKAGEIREFAIVFCDVNDLKKTNDSEGHDKGDLLIKKACALICDIFKHSPVYRIGGDEFAVVLRGSDYDSRESLVSSLVRKAYYGDVSIACGYSAYSSEDTGFSSVFKRADAKMYENKKRIKNGSVPHLM